MKLEGIVTSLELSENLEMVGVKQESLFYWNFSQHLEIDNSNISGNLELKKGEKRWEVGYKYRWIDQVSAAAPNLIKELSAFTAAELTEIIPKGTWLNVFNHSLEFQVQDKDLGLVFADKNLANALAKMIIYLIENNLIKL
jgi:hypothetical protein